MTTAVQHRRGTTAEHATFTGLEGEVTIDTTKDTAVIHDGVLAGGVPLARENLANVTPSGLATITGASTASDDKFFIYDQSATTLKSITRAELNNAMEVDALSNVTITGGTINGTTIGNTTAAAGTFTQVNFADNAKAIFGAGSDLQIYHDGTNSYVSDQGTGNLRLLAANFQLRNAANNAGMITAADGGSVYLYDDGDEKFRTTSTGIDVTGTVVASGDITANGGDVTISGDQPRINLTENDTTDLDVTLRVNAGDFIIETRSDAGAALGDRIRASSNGDISFYEDTGTTAKFFWDASAESLGIGESAPLSELVVGGNASTTAKPTVAITDTTSGASITLRGQSPILSFDVTSAGVPKILMDGAGIEFKTGTLDAQGDVDLKIDSSGNLLVGKSSVNNSSEGTIVDPNGTIKVVRSSEYLLQLNRTTTDGEIARFQKDGTAVGSIGTNGGRPYLVNPTYGGLKIGTGYSVDPALNSTGAGWDNSIDLGAGGTRWKDLYLSGGVYVGGTAAANHLDDYEEGTWTPVVADAASGGNEAPSYTNQYGTYTKVGRVVTITVDLININSTGLTDSNDLYIRNLPFSVFSTTGGHQFSSIVAYGSWGVVGELVAAVIPDNNPHIRFTNPTVTGTTVYYNCSRLDGNATDLRFSLTYFAP